MAVRIAVALLVLAGLLFGQQFFLFDGGQGVTFSTSDFEIVAGEFRLKVQPTVCRTTAVVCSPASPTCTPGPFTLGSVDNLAVYANGVRVTQGDDYTLNGLDLTYVGFTLGAQDKLVAETITPCP